MSLHIVDKTTGALTPVAGNVNPSDVIELKATKADKTQISNPNLLDNPWFTVNQRGVTSWVASEVSQYRFDRWLFDAGDGSYTNGVVTNTNAFYQMQEDARVVPLFGKTVTISWMLSDGTIGHETSTVPNSLTSEYVGIFTNPYVQALFHSGNLSQLARVSANVAVKAVKLEIGSISTLAMDTAPNYATELLKCQRYFLRLPNTGSTFASIGFGSSYSTTEAEIMIPIPVAMRKLPVLTSNGNFVIRGGGTGMVVTLSGLYQYSSNSVSIVVTGVNIVNNQAYHMYVDNNANAHIDLSADL